MGVFGNGYIHETSTIHKAFIGFKIKNQQDLWESAKKGSYPGLLEFINKCDEIDDLDYLNGEIKFTADQTCNTIKERIEKCKNGESNENKKYYSFIKKNYIDRGVKPSDIEKYKNWLKNTLSPRISERKKELRNSRK